MNGTGRMNKTARESQPVLHTPRLRLRPYADGDRGWFLGVFCGPVVMRHAGGAMSEQSAAALFDLLCGGNSSPRVFAGWCAVLDGEPAGHGALLREGEGLEIVYILPRDLWGCGYATEIARALRDHARDSLGRARLIATIDIDHPRSLRVLKGIGMTVQERRQDAQGGYLVCVTAERCGP